MDRMLLLEIPEQPEAPQRLFLWHSDLGQLFLPSARQYLSGFAELKAE
jgi:hypothetical protein